MMCSNQESDKLFSLQELNDMTVTEKETMNSSAIFSDDRKYRYVLCRSWDDKKPSVCFIGMNPSKANESDDDATIRRVIRFSKDWGYGTVYMLNLFAYVSTDADAILKVNNPVGDLNDMWLEQISAQCDRVIFAWGAFKKARERSQKVIDMFPTGHALKLNADKSPMHPLFVPAITKPFLYRKAL